MTLQGAQNLEDVNFTISLPHITTDLDLVQQGDELLFTVPAGWLWQRFSPYVTLPPQVQVGTVSGQVWQGAAAVNGARR